MSDMFLEPDEIKALTGRIQHQSQARELNHLGIVHKVRTDGSILVLRAHVEQVLGLKAKERKAVEFEPNWAAAAEPNKSLSEALRKECAPEDR